MDHTRFDLPGTATLPPMSAWKLTVRHGSDVSRSEFDALDPAIEEMRARAQEIQAEGPLDRVSSLRDFEPSEQVHARLELSGRGLLRPPTAGVDVQGDGSLIPYAGAVRRRVLSPARGQDAFAAVGAALRG